MKKQWKWAIGIVVFCILAPIAWTITSLGLRFHAEDDGAAVVSQFLAVLNAHDYTKAHALMAPSEQAAVSVAAVQEAQEQIEKKHGGHWVSPAMPNERHANEAVDHITFFYTVDFKKQYDEIFMMVRVVHTDDGWRVLEYHYDFGAA